MVMYCDICGAKLKNGEQLTECPECLCSFINTDKSSNVKSFKSKIPNGSLIKQISTDEAFMDAIFELYQKDPIEYQLKIQQFKTKLQQQEQPKSEPTQSSNQPKCPHCSSTKIAKISGTERAGSILMWGIFSKKINKSFKCNNCGYTW